MAYPEGHPINIPTSEESDDDYSTKTKIVKLNRNNWHDWKSAFEDVVIGKGHEEILSEDWIKEHLDSKTYRRKNALALSLLRTSVDKDLQSCIKASKSNFLKAYKALALERGENSLIVIGDALIRLVNLTYEPGKSLCEYTSAFKNAYVNLTEMIEGQPPEERIMNVLSGLAAVLFIKSLRLDDVMSSLVSTLYDLRPFTLETISNRVLLEDSRRVLNSTESSYFTSKPRSIPRQPPRGTPHHDKNKQLFRPKSVIPTKKNPQSQYPDQIAAQIKRLDREIKQLKTAHSINAVEEDSHEGTSEVAEECANLVSDKDEDPEECGFLAQEDTIYNVNYSCMPSCELVYDSGASRSTVCNISLLQDPRPIHKNLNTYGGSIKITHVGKLDVGGTTIYPVFYAPQGPRNLISATKLEDHGLKVVHKHRMVLVKLANSVVYRFPRIGNLYIAHHNPMNEINLVGVNRSNKDWHVALGHPSDVYLKKFLSLHNIRPQSIPSLLSCKVCLECKMKQRSHSNPLPTLTKPFHRLHLDVLQITPPCKQFASYILAIIDDFSRFN